MNDNSFYQLSDLFPFETNDYLIF